MDKLVIRGGRRLSGSIHVGGSKNTALPMMAAAILAAGKTTLHNIPVLRDIQTFSNVLRVTENVAAIVGFAEALRRVVGRRMEDSTRIALLRNRLATSILEKLGSDIIINTPLDNSAPHILNLSIPPKDGRPIDGEMLLLGLDLQGVMASAGSACASGAVEPSHVLAGIGLPPETAQACVRLSVGRNTTEDDINKAVDVLTDVVNRQRATR